MTTDVGTPCVRQTIYFGRPHDTKRRMRSHLSESLSSKGETAREAVAAENLSETTNGRYNQNRGVFNRHRKILSALVRTLHVMATWLPGGH